MMLTTLILAFAQSAATPPVQTIVRDLRPDPAALIDTTRGLMQGRTPQDRRGAAMDDRALEEAIDMARFRRPR